MWVSDAVRKARQRRSHVVNERASAHEILPLSMQNRRTGRRELLQTLFIIGAELIDNTLDIANFISFMREPSMSDNTVYRILYILCTIGVSTFSLFVLLKHIQHANTIRGEIYVGIQVAKGRKSRMQRSRSKEVVPSEWSEDLEWADNASSSEFGVFKTMSTNSLNEPFEAEPSQHKVVELELERLQRRQTRARLIVIGAFAEDLTTFLFALYRVFFTTYIVNEVYIDCLDVQVIDGDSFPIKCTSHQLILAILQLTGSLFLFAFKSSFVRDYQLLQSLTNDLKQELERDSTQDSSILDLYKDGQVSNTEINKVVQIRKICRYPGHNTRFGSDWLILQLLRTNRGDQIAAAQSLQALLTWRRKRGASGIKRQLLTNDMAWDDIPNLSKVNSVLPYVDAYKIDEQNNQLVQYAYIGGRADYDCLLHLVQKEDLLTCFIYVVERALLLLENISNRTGRLHELTILCDARGNPDQEGLELFLRVFCNICEVLGQYPIRPKLILWQPGTELTELARSFPHAHCVTSKKMLGILLSPDCIPVELGGRLCFGNQSTVLSQVDPWQLRQCHFLPLSKGLGHTEIDLHFYHDVTESEANAVLALRRLISVVDQQERHGEPLPVPNSSRQIDLALLTRQASDREISLLTLRKRLKAFHSDGGALYLVSSEIASHLMLLRFVRKYMSLSELKQYEDSQNLRFDVSLRSCGPSGILAAAIGYVDMLLMRHKLKLDDLNARIKKEKIPLAKADANMLRISEAAHFEPLMGYDAAHGQILAFHAEGGVRSSDVAGLSHDEIFRTCATIFEYWLILIQSLSSQEERVVSVRDISHLSSLWQGLASSWRVFHQSMQELCVRYPSCVKSDQITIVQKVWPSTVNMIRRVTSYVQSTSSWTKPAKPRLMVSLCDRVEALNWVDLAQVPKSLTGNSTRSDMLNSSFGEVLAVYTTSIQRYKKIWPSPENLQVSSHILSEIPGKAMDGNSALVLRDSTKLYMPLKLPRFYTDTHIRKMKQTQEQSPLALLLKGHTLQTIAHHASTRERTPE